MSPNPFSLRQQWQENENDDEWTFRNMYPSHLFRSSSPDRPAVDTSHPVQLLIIVVAQSSRTKL